MARVGHFLICTKHHNTITNVWGVTKSTDLGFTFDEGRCACCGSIARYLVQGDETLIQDAVDAVTRGLTYDMF